MFLVDQLLAANHTAPGHEPLAIPLEVADVPMTDCSQLTTQSARIPITGVLVQKQPQQQGFVMSEEPKIAGLAPVKVQLEAGKNYAFCTCGHSSKQPFCDGAHRGSAFRPNVFIAEQDEEVWMCLCKHTHNDYKCDGTHKQLRDQQASQ